MRGKNYFAKLLGNFFGKLFGKLFLKIFLALGTETKLKMLIKSSYFFGKS
jgi:hypothetical protein